ncbi:MAG: hypothetical protein J0M12_03010 [Deltaproteobacteria bacterium]|nr:hypothetical protein [Deltaproteobacteria bacterium]
MDFKIDKSRSTIGVGKSDGGKAITHSSDPAGELKKALSTPREEVRQEDLASFAEQQAATGDTLVISNIKNSIELSNQAINEVLELKTRQLHLAQVAANLPEITAQHDQVSQETKALGSMIRDIENIKDKSGQPVLVGKSYSLVQSEGEVRDGIVTGGIVLYAGRYDLSSRSTAETSVEGIEEEFVSYRAMKAAYSAAAGKAENLVPVSKEEVFTVKEERPDALTSVEAAQELAGSIARKLGSAYGDPTSVSKLIESSTEGLDLERVKNLLG